MITIITKRISSPLVSRWVRFAAIFIVALAFAPACALAATQIFYSVGQNTSDHKTGSPTVTISGTTATFSVGQTATNMGVGDKVTWGNTGVGYITGKTSPFIWSISTATGGTPTATTSAPVNSITHAFASLNAALGRYVAGNATSTNFLNTSDLVAGNYVLNIPLYYDSGPDTTETIIAGITTGASNYINIYTPTSTASQVNQTQRHSGKWDSTKWALDTSDPFQTLFTVVIGYIRLDGLQVRNTASNGTGMAIGRYDAVTPTPAALYISNSNIFASSTTGLGFSAETNTGRKVYIWNNLFNTTSGTGINFQYGSWDNAYIYNNTFYDNVTGVFTLSYDNPAYLLKNNLFASTTNPVAIGGAINSSSDYNSTASTSLGYTANTHDRVSQTFSFVTTAGWDFHLLTGDAGAKDRGVSLSADAALPFNVDNENQTRPSGSFWDVGADEYTAASVPSVNTDPATSTGPTTGTLIGNVTATNGALVTTRGLAYGLTTAYGATTTDSGSYVAGVFSASVSSLSCNTLYHVRAYATNSAGTGYGSDQTFTTGTCATVPVMTIQAPSSVSSTTATFNATITDVGSGNATLRGFVYGLTTAYGFSTSTSGSYSAGAYSQSVTGLTCNTLYHVMASSTNASGTGTSTDTTFTTLQCNPPTVTSNAASNITQTSATLTGNITALGGLGTSTIFGFNYGTTPSFGLVASSTSSTTPLFNTVSPVSLNIYNLTCNTTYYFNAYAYNGATATSSTRNFTTSACAPTAILDASRKIDWTTNAALNFTIPSWPNGRNAVTNDGATGNGVTDDTAAIQSCVDNAPSNTFCYLPAGTYKITTAIVLAQPGGGYKGIRGAGPNYTKLVAAYPGDMINNSSYSPSGTIKVVSGAIKDSTRVYLDPYSSQLGSFYSVGDFMLIYQDPGDSYEENIPAYISNPIGQIVKITARNGNAMDLETPIHYDFKTGLSVSAKVYWAASRQLGIESLTLEKQPAAGASGNNINIDSCVNCWIKNVRSKDAGNWHVRYFQTYGSIVRDSWFEQTWQYNCGGNACYGAAIYGNSSDDLVENNVMIRLRHSLITESGGAGNIFGYNYSRQPINENGLSTDYLMGDIITHGGHPFMNLWEGNTAATIRFDNVLGSSINNTAFRNNIEVKSIPGVTNVAMFGIDDQVGNVYENYLGNIFGSSGQMTQFARWGCWQDICSGLDYLNRSLPDLRASTTAYLHGNYNFLTSLTTWDSTNSNHTLPSSLYLSGQPSWWNSSPFPAIGPDVSGLYNDIPAYTRYVASTTAAVISSIGSSPGQTTATITWNTDEVASSTVAYGPTTAYGTASSSTAYVTSHSISLTGLSSNTTYQFKIYATDLDGNVSSSTNQTFTTTAGGTGPTVVTSAASSVATSTVTFNGSISSVGSADATQSGFAYGTVANLSTVIATSTLGAQTGTASFSSNITGLTPNTTYYVRAYATNPYGTAYGSIQSFTTNAITAPTVSASAASSITATAATLNGNITATGGNTATQSGFAYGTVANLSSVIATSTLGAQTGTASFSSGISSLTCNTTYYFRPYATNTGGTGYGSIASFTTSACAPTVTTSAASSLGNSSATLNGSISATGGANATIRGFAYGLTTAYGATTTESGSFSTGSFSASASSLTCATLYHVRAYATNPGGDGYGSDQTFTTSACAAPTVTASAASSLAKTSATLNGTITATGGQNATQSGFAYGTTSSLSAVIATSTLGTQTGTASFSTSASSLTCETLYYFRPYATNPTGTGYGSILSFTTSSCTDPVTVTPVTVAPPSGSSVARRVANLAAQATQSIFSAITGTPAAPAAPQSVPTLSRFIDILISVGVIPQDKAEQAKAAAAAPVVSQAPQANLGVGSNGASVQSLQNILSTQGYLKATPNGNFGPSTTAALKAFQREHGIPATGYYGPLTRAAMAAGR